MNRDPLDTRAQQREADAHNERVQLAIQQEIDDVRSVMKSPAGRRMLARHLDRTGVESISFTGNSTTFFNEGRRSVGVELQQFLKTHAPDEYLLMVREGLHG